MPLHMNSELRFPMGDTTPLCENAAEEFIVLAKKITSTYDQKNIFETFKKYFCRACGEQYISSSNLNWAESDLERDAHWASSDAPNFIAAFYDACEDLGKEGIAVPDPRIMNNILEKYSVPFRIIDKELQSTNVHITPPRISTSPENIIDKALSDAKALIGHSNASSAIDRAHTSLHGYLVDLCKKNNIDINENVTTSKAFKLLRQSHPALSPSGPRSSDVTRILQAFATSIDAFSTLRNKASLAHANELLNVPEATATVNAIYTVFRYIQDCLQRYGH